MFGIFKRFPHFSESIFDNLDNQSLINCKEASRELSEFFESERFFWIRMLRNYSKHYHTFQDSWKMAINRTSIEIVKHLAVATKIFFKSQNKHLYEIIDNGSYIISETRNLKQFTPIHVAIEFGNLELIEHVLERIRKKISIWKCDDKISVRAYSESVGEKKSIPLYLSARKGNLEVCGLIIGMSCGYPADWKKLTIAIAKSHFVIAKLLMTDKLEEKIIPKILEEHPFEWKL